MDAITTNVSEARQRYQEAVRRAAQGDEAAQASLPGLWAQIEGAEEDERHARAVERETKKLAEAEALEQAEAARVQSIDDAIAATDRRTEAARDIEKAIRALAQAWRKFDQATTDAQRGRRFVSPSAVSAVRLGHPEIEVMLGCLGRQLGISYAIDIALQSAYAPPEGWAGWVAKRDANTRRLFESVRGTEKDAA